MKGVEVTRQKLKRIFCWIRNRKFRVVIVYEYNNSMGHYDKRKYTGIIKDFEIIDYDGVYKVRFEFDTGEKGEEWLNSSWEFAGKFNAEMLILRYCNSGPYCYFGIKIEK